MKLSMDDEGHAVLKKTEDGKMLPVYEYEDGTKKEFDAGATLEGLTKKINSSEEEKERHFDKATKLEEKLKSFSGIEDVEKAQDALRIVKNLSDKKLLDDKGVEAVKAEVRNDMKILAEEREESLKNAHGKDRDEWDSKFLFQENLIRSLVIDNLFANSEYFSGEKPKTIYPAEDASQIFGRHFSIGIENNKVKVTAKDNNGKTIISKIEHGEPADFNEAIGLIIDKHPRKNEILRTGKAGGPGSDGNLDHKGKKFSDMTSVEKIASGLKKHQRQTGS
jgi:hypothetical protein